MLPKKLRVKRATYTIKLVDAKLYWKGSEVRGYCLYQKKEIIVSTKQTKRMILSTFWHEVMHAISHENRINLHHPRMYDLEGPFADLFLGNPQLRRIIQTWQPRRAKRSE